MKIGRYLLLLGVIISLILSACGTATTLKSTKTPKLTKALEPTAVPINPNQPKAFSKIAPLNDATNQPLNVTLTWGASEGAVSYWYCLRMTKSSCSWVNNGTSTMVTLNNLSPNTTYYWHVKAVNSFGTTYTGNNLSTSFRSFKTGVNP